MDQSDIKYILELIGDGLANKDWDAIEEANEILKEFLDNRNNEEDE